MTINGKLFDPNIFETDLDFYVLTPVRVSDRSPAQRACQLDQGFNFLDFLIPADRSRAHLHAKFEFEGLQVGAETYCIQTEENEEFTIALEIEPLREAGRPTGMRLTVTELTTSKSRLTPTPLRGVKPYQA